MALFLPKRWKLKPPLGTGIDWGHPLAKNLVFCALFNEGGGSGAMDLVRNTRGTFGDAPTWLADRLDFDGSDVVSWTNAQVPDAEFLADVTLVWRGTIDTGSAFRHFMGKHLSNGASATNPFDFRTSNAATPAMVLIRRGDESTGGPDTVLGVEKQYAASHVAGAAVGYFVDKVRTNGSAIPGPTGGEAGDLRIGRRADGAVQMDGQCRYAYIYNRALSTEEIAWLYDEPYSMFMPIKQRIYVNLEAGPGPGGTVGVVFRRTLSKMGTKVGSRQTL